MSIRSYFELGNSQQAVLLRLIVAVCAVYVSCDRGGCVFAQGLDLQGVSIRGGQAAAIPPVVVELEPGNGAAAVGQSPQASDSVALLEVPKVSAAAGEQPNVLFLAIDDLNDWIGALGGAPSG
ncbi:hypothetical protein OAL01_03230 [Rubripirellula sp.]|nr:hypothetical protein [Rubripirellula sp.]